MKEGGVIVLGGTDCAPGQDEQYNRWFNEVHIPMLMKFKGLKAVWRGKLINEANGQPRYVVVYQFDTQEDFEAYQESAERKAALVEMEETSKILPSQAKWRLPFEIMKTWQK